MVKIKIETKEELVDWINKQIELEALIQEGKSEANKLSDLTVIRNLQYTSLEHTASEYLYQGRLGAFNEILNLLGEETEHDKDRN